MPGLKCINGAFRNVRFVFQEEGWEWRRMQGTGMNTVVRHAKEFGPNPVGSWELCSCLKLCWKWSDLICQLIIMALWKAFLERGSSLEPGDMSSSVSSANIPSCFSYCLIEWSGMMCASERWVFVRTSQHTLEYFERVLRGKTRNPYPALFPP